MPDSSTAIDLLTRLVSIPSPSHLEFQAAAYLVDWMNSHGFKAQLDEANNAVGVKGSGPKEILLLGHIDTFPGEIPVRRDGDLLYGRGTVDAKGPLCGFAVAAARLKIPDDWRVTVAGAVEEEAATSKGARHILARRLDSPPVCCVIGEPSSWDRITLGYKGRLLMNVTLRVPFSHSAGEQKLPAEQAVDLWRAIETYCVDWNSVQQATTQFYQLSPSLRHISSQDAGAFGLVELSIGFRLPVGLSPNEVEQSLGELLEQLPSQTSAQVEFAGAEFAHKGGKSNPLVRAFLRSIRAYGGKPRFVVKTGTADMNVVAPHWPLTPIVAYGPGDSSLDHTPQEHINLQEYLQAINVLTGTLQTFMQL